MEPHQGFGAIGSGAIAIQAATSRRASRLLSSGGQPGTVVLSTRCEGQQAASRTAHQGGFKGVQSSNVQGILPSSSTLQVKSTALSWTSVGTASTSCREYVVPSSTLVGRIIASLAFGDQLTDQLPDR